MFKEQVDANHFLFPTGPVDPMGRLLLNSIKFIDQEHQNQILSPTSMVTKHGIAIKHGLESTMLFHQKGIIKVEHTRHQQILLPQDIGGELIQWEEYQ